MTPKLKSFIIFVLTSSITYGQVQKSLKYINPIGIYKLDARTEVKNGDTFGYFGNIMVRAIDSSKILVSLYVCKGAPSYNSGSLIDTLTYINNIAIYTPESDSTCIITLSFSKKGITIEQKQANLNFGCDFGHGVFSDGIYKRISNKTPSIEEMEFLSNGNIE